MPVVQERIAEYACYGIVLVLSVIAGVSDVRTRNVSNVYPAAIAFMRLPLAILLFEKGQALYAIISTLISLVPGVALFLFCNNSGKETIGWADIKMMGAISIALGIKAFIIAVPTAIVSAAIIRASATAVKKLRHAKKTEETKEEQGVPLCAYLAVGVAVVPFFSQ